MRQYQYVVYLENQDVVGALNNWAKDGWRVVSIVPLVVSGAISGELAGAHFRYYVLFEKEV